MKKLSFVLSIAISLTILSGCISESEAEQQHIQGNINRLNQEKQDLEDTVKYLRDTSNIVYFVSVNKQLFFN